MPGVDKGNLLPLAGIGLGAWGAWSLYKGARPNLMTLAALAAGGWGIYKLVKPRLQAVIPAKPATVALPTAPGPEPLPSPSQTIPQTKKPSDAEAFVAALQGLWGQVTGNETGQPRLAHPQYAAHPRAYAYYLQQHYPRAYGSDWGGYPQGENETGQPADWSDRWTGLDEAETIPGAPPAAETGDMGRQSYAWNLRTDQPMPVTSFATPYPPPAGGQYVRGL